MIHYHADHAHDITWWWHVCLLLSFLACWPCVYCQASHISESKNDPIGTWKNEQAASHLVKRMVPDTKMTIGTSKKIHVKGKEGKNAETKKKHQKFVASLLAVLRVLRISTRHATAWRLWFWRPLWCPQAAVPRFWRSTLNWYEWPRIQRKWDEICIILTRNAEHVTPEIDAFSPERQNSWSWGPKMIQFSRPCAKCCQNRLKLLMFHGLRLCTGASRQSCKV